MSEEENRQSKLDYFEGVLSLYCANHNKELKALPLTSQRNILVSAMKNFFVFETDFPFKIDDQEIQTIIDNHLIVGDVAELTILNTKNWKPWLKDKKKHIRWDYSKRYFDYLIESKHWAKETVDSIDESSDEILNHFGNPFAKEDVYVKGLVVGDIQSGKTASYTALINKAIDAGFKLIIVFTGTTNDLRVQTQKRLDKEVLGLTTVTNLERQEIIGVGKIRRLQPKVSMITNSATNGDLKKQTASYSFSKESSALIAVIKKNVAPLKSIIEMIKKSPSTALDPKGMFPLPVLIIDDEADLASINSSKSDQVAAATATNRLIRTLLWRNCHNITYVGYTATPFANVFIKPYSQVNKNDADDIFPDDFIAVLPTPPDYSGANAYFGITPKTLSQDPENETVKKDLLRIISEEDRQNFREMRDKSIPMREQEALWFPDSLQEAMKCFLISTGIKISRGIRENCTMLVNVDVRVIFNGSLRDSVREKFNQLCDTFETDEETQLQFKKYWEEKMKPVSIQRLQEEQRTFKDSWEKIKAGILEAISWKLSDSVKLITGSSDADELDYSKRDFGIFVVVGGPKLSRGLTLEGLSVSYYARSAKTFDALLQMGRWFGYRKGWLDLCRVFTTRQIADDFIAAAKALEEFKGQVKVMNKKHSTPTSFGLHVRTYTFSRLMPTSRARLRHASKEKLTFSGSVSQVLDYRYSQKNKNRAAVEKLISGLRRDSTKVAGGNVVFSNIPSSRVLDFFKEYNTPSNTVEMWYEYVKSKNKEGGLTTWTIVLSSLKHADASRNYKIGGYSGLLKARRKILTKDSSGCSLKVLSTPSDFFEFYSDEEKISGSFLNEKGEKLDHYDPTNDYIMETFGKQNALLSIYPFDATEEDDVIAEGTDLLGLSVWYPVNDDDEEFVYSNVVETSSLHRQSDVKNSKENEEEKQNGVEH